MKCVTRAVQIRGEFCAEFLRLSEDASSDSL
jgi:hypothetical protein